MCFAPKISLATAIIEFFVATFLLVRFKWTTVVKFTTVFIYLLGLYQFTEFMLCTVGDAGVWGRVGFVAYNALPAVAVDFTLRYVGHKFRGGWLNWLLYLPTVIFAATAVFTPGFISEGTCSTVFVVIKTLFFRDVGFPLATFAYWAYYFGYIAIACGMLFKGFLKEPHRTRRGVYFMMLLALLLSLMPALLFIVIMPSFGVMFPSVYCQFALLFAVFAFIAVYLDRRYQKEFFENG